MPNGTFNGFLQLRCPQLESIEGDPSFMFDPAVEEWMEVGPSVTFSILTDHDIAMNGDPFHIEPGDHDLSGTNFAIGLPGYEITEIVRSGVAAGDSAEAIALKICTRRSEVIGKQL